MIGDLRHRITIQSVTNTQDLESGEIHQTWATFAERWASVVPAETLSQRHEYWEAAQEQVKLTHVVTIRYTAGVTAAMRVLFGSRVLDIQTVVDLGERNKTMELLCTEQVIV